MTRALIEQNGVGTQGVYRHFMCGSDQSAGRGLTDLSVWQQSISQTGGE